MLQLSRTSRKALLKTQSSMEPLLQNVIWNKICNMGRIIGIFRINMTPFPQPRSPMRLLLRQLLTLPRTEITKNV